MNFPSFCVHERFEAQAKQTPEAIAVVCEGASLTYAQLNARANQLARHLLQRGVSPGTPVGLCLERSVEMIVAILAVLKAGGAYVPIDLAYPKDRLAFMIEDSRAPVIISQESLLASLPTHGAEVVRIDADWSEIERHSSANLGVTMTEESVAYIIFTSGSTGKPKGCLVTHRNVARLFTATDTWFHFNRGDVWTLFHSYAFDFSVWEIWGALLFGGKLVVVPYLVSRSPRAFYELLSREKVTVLNQTPSAFRQLIWAEADHPLPLSLRYVIFGGEALELQSLKPWFARHGDSSPLLINMYGITETTVHVTYRPIRQPDVERGAGSVIGIPIPDLQVHVLDETMQPVPEGHTGEMFVGGAGVAKGYLNRPELTRERFLPDPFSSDLNARLYRTGDVARRLPDGDLEYLGRIDHQVKIRGFRIELGEIEAALNQHEAIRECIVVAQSRSGGDKRLVAYLVVKKDIPSVSSLREWLLRTLPDYMVPSAFLFLNALALTPNGKVDRKALPSPDRARPELKAEFLAARNETERNLAEIWSSVLEIENVGVRDNFFELGGDSIRSIAVLSRAEKAGLAVSLADLFRYPTIEQLAARSKDSAPKMAAPKTQPFSLVKAEDRARLPVDLDDAYPMIQLQTGMFYHNELNPLSAVYHDVFSFAISSKFDSSKLEQAVRQLIERHPVLRTSFHIAGFSEPLQLVHRHVAVPFTVEDLRHLSAPEQTDRLVAWIETEKRVAFDPKKAPLLRFHTQLHGDQSFQFIVSFHHVYLDGWSLAALMTEIFQDYAALLQNTGETIEPPRIAYREFVALERETVQSPETRRFWRQQLEDAKVQTLPRWPKELCAGGHEQVRGPEIIFDEKILEGLKRLAQNAGVPLKTVLLAAHQRVMGFLYGQNDVMSGLVCNGRPEEIDGEKIIGLFLNTLPVRQELSGGSWLDLVKQTATAEQSILPHRRFPLAEIQKMNGNQPVFEAAFDFVHFHVYRNLLGYEGMGFMEGHYFEANNLTLLTTFMLDVTSTQLQMHFDYDPNLLCREQIESMCGHYAKTLEVMALNPDESYNAFSPLSDSERTRLLEEWNDTRRAYSSDRTAFDLFTDQVKSNPDALAVRSGEATATYSQLAIRSRQIAVNLQNAGARRGDLVGVYLERSIDLVAALLGILQAGAAYVPLDPSYPSERLRDMISDARMPMILTQQKLAGSLPESEARILSLEDLSETSGESQPIDIGPLDPAYVIYTSGSTGKPKGVQIPHRALVNLLTSMAEIVELKRGDHWLAVTTISFDIAGLEIFMPLITGASLTLAPREAAADATQLAKLIETSSATFMQATPATWRLLLDNGWAGRSELTILCGGEALTRKLADELLPRAQTVWNVYGPTETTIWSSVWKVQPEQTISIGQPIANTQFYILDGNLHPTPIGVAGELFIGGDGLATGYLNRPELTKEKFIDHPFRANERLYRTGDLARYRPDGSVECLGRNDHQVKIRGYRIELGDIESALRQYPSISEALVTAMDGASDDKRLIAYYTPRGGETLPVSDMREYLRTKLPEYMIPAAFVPLPAFPLTPAGKIDRKALPAPDPERPELGQEFIEPSSPLEIEIAQVWKDVFQIEKIGRDDNFFELGGHSLLAIQITARVRQKLGIELALPTIFTSPTIGRLAETVFELLMEKSDDETKAWLDELSDEEARKLLSSS